MAIAQQQENKNQIDANELVHLLGLKEIDIYFLKQQIQMLNNKIEELKNTTKK